MAGEPNLSPNTSSEWVLYLQQLLNHHFQSSVVPESGEFDEATAAAVRHLREQNGLDDTDEVDDTVWAVLTGSSSSSGSGAGAGHDGGHSGGHSGGQSHEDSSGGDAGHGGRQWPEATSVKVWVNAFIPGSYHDNVDGVGAAAGHRLLPGPSSWFNDCFHTDDREFDNDIGASARMHSEFRLDLATMNLTEWHGVGETVEYDCEDGDVECRETADTGRMHWSNLHQAGSVITVDLAAAANNPCFSGSFDIDYTGTVTIDLSSKTISFAGAVNGFPAYEAYATINDGAGETLFTHGPAGSPADLAGDADQAVTGSVTF